MVKAEVSAISLLSLLLIFLISFHMVLHLFSNDWVSLAMILHLINHAFGFYLP